MKFEFRKVEWRKGDWYWTADLKEIPGSPKLGFGKTKEAAIVDFFRTHLYQTREAFKDSGVPLWHLNELIREGESVEFEDAPVS